MTFKQIAQDAGCGERTARRYAKKLWPDRTFSGRMGMTISDSDAVKLMEVLPKKNMVSVQTGQVTAQAGQSAGHTGQMTAQDFLAMIPAIVAETVKQILPLIQPPHAIQKALPFVPDIPVRKQIANIVNEAVMKANGGRRPAPVAFENAYHKLYKDFGDRYGIDVETRAENRGIKPIEYLEREGKLEELWLCAMRLFGMAS